MIKSIGIYLKYRRTEQDLTLDQVEQQTRIQKEILKKIEQDNFSSIGSHVYVKGFIKSYAKFLKVDSENLIAIYKRDFENTIIKRKLILEKEEPAKAAVKTSHFEKIRITRRQISIFLTIFFIAITLLSTITFVSSIFSKPYIKILTPIIVDGPQEERITLNEINNTIIFSGETESGTSIFINDEPIDLKTGFIFESEPIPITGTRNLIKIEARSSLGRTSSIEFEIIKVQNTDSVEQETEIIIEAANGNSFMLVRTDGTIKYNDQIFKGDIIAVKGKDTFEIESTNPESLIIKVGLKEYTLEKIRESFTIKDNLLIKSDD